MKSIPRLNSYGTWTWYKGDKLHREGDLPAVVQTDGEQEWYKNDERHRKDGPAIIRANGDRFWYKHGRCHREDGPAIIHANGIQEWYKDNKRHRDGDLPAVANVNVIFLFWYKDGKYHRDVGPALLYPSPKFYEHGVERDNGRTLHSILVSGAVLHLGKMHHNPSCNAHCIRRSRLQKHSKIGGCLFMARFGTVSMLTSMA